MRRRDLILAACLAAMAAGCQSGQERAARAAAEGQMALDRGDLPAARIALARAVREDDGSAVLWAALGRAHIAANDLPGAYDAFSRVAELDRTNAEALQILADLSLLRNQPREAERYADELELLQPGSPGPITTKGFAALLRSRPDDAIKAADTVLAMLPFDPGASILKARALDAKGMAGDGARLLEAQVEMRGPSRSVLDSLLAIYRKADDGPGLLRTRQRLSALAPDDPAATLAYARELYRAGDRAAGRRLSLRLAGNEAASAQLAEVLSLWAEFEPRPQALDNARAIEGTASLPRRVAIGRFLLDVGEADRAEALLAPHADGRPRPENADAVAVFAHAQALGGRPAQALPLLDRVLAFDPTNISALRARTDARLALGRTEQALADARRLVDENPSEPADRIRLARCYQARGQNVQAERVYWQAFNELPGSPGLYGAFKAFLDRSGKADAAAALSRRYAEQRQTLRTRGA